MPGVSELPSAHPFFFFRATSLTTPNFKFYYLETQHSPELQPWPLALRGTVLFFALQPLQVFTVDANKQLSLLFIKETGRGPDETG